MVLLEYYFTFLDSVSAQALVWTTKVPIILGLGQVNIQCFFILQSLLGCTCIVLMIDLLSIFILLPYIYIYICFLDTPEWSGTFFLEHAGELCIFIFREKELSNYIMNAPHLGQE